MLRHGHAAATNLEKEQWHNADQVHRGDPDAHNRENSFVPDLARWSHNNWQLSNERKQELIFEAKRAHDLVADSLPSIYNPYSSFNKNPAPDPAYSRRDEEPTLDYTPPPVPTTPTESTGDEIIDMLAALPARVDSLEAGTAALASQQSDIKQSVRSAAEGIGDLRGDVALVNSRIHEQNRLATDAHKRLDDVEDRIKPLEEAAARKIEITISNNGASTTFSGIQHERFPKLIKLATSLKPYQRNIWLSGPVGSGKTSAARELAGHLNLPFKFHGAIGTPFQLTGYLNPVGKYVGTAFRDIYENGGVILLDECDGSSANALLELNAALANSHVSFPDGMIERHENCYVVAAANTWGFGGDGNYVGRARLDAAFLDRFITLSWPYDEVFESQLANNLTWVAVVHEVRRTAFQLGAQFVISPRASILGAQLLAAGNEPEDVVEAVFGRYRSDPMWPRIGKAAEDYAKTPTPSQALAATTNGTAKPGSLLGPIDFSKVYVYGLDK